MLAPSSVSSQPPKDLNTYRRTKRGWNTKVPHSGCSPKKFGDEAINEEMLDSVERAITTYVSLEAAQNSDNINRPKPWQRLMSLILKEKFQPNEPPLSEGHTSGSGEGRMEHQFELTANVLDLEKAKDAQAMEILKLKKQVKRLERQRKSNTSQPRRRKYRQVESSDDDLDEEDASK
ncbi:hypothetical protein Tco_0267925 [Tanacetum coccineum]